MKINFDAPDDWAALLDEEAAKDGHSNRAAVIRKIVNLFFADRKNFLELSERREVIPDAASEQEQRKEVKP